MEQEKTFEKYESKSVGAGRKKRIARSALKDDDVLNRRPFKRGTSSMKELRESHQEVHNHEGEREASNASTLKRSSDRGDRANANAAVASPSTPAQS